MPNPFRQRHNPDNTPTTYTFDRVVRIVGWFLLIAAIVGLMAYLRDALLPFVVGCLIAYLIEPLVKFNMRLLRLRWRMPAVILTLLELLTLITGLTAIFLPQAIEEGHKIGELFQRYADTDASAMSFLPPWVHRFLHGNIDLRAVGEFFKSQNTEKSLGAVANFFTGGLDAIGGMVAWAVVILYVIFILCNYPSIMQGIKNIVPPRFRAYSNPIISDVSSMMKRYFRTQALISIITGTLYAIGFAIVGLPLAIAIGLINALLFMVPYLVYVSLIPVTLLCVVASMETGIDFWELWLKCIAVYALVQCISDLFLTPHIMGRSMNLDPAVILLSLSIWGTLLGFLGMVLALPLSTIVISYYRRYILGETNPNDPTSGIDPPDISDT